ncbi:hypothetical protein TRVA0_005S01574 [Trichomonascus vanleenenianus]|uniref:uncharacterized protein n=1 Tax=Trichomonascus vanleenenianus TaxID=2268995 RepID=UPI003EC9FBD1
MSGSSTVQLHPRNDRCAACGFVSPLFFSRRSDTYSESATNQFGARPNLRVRITVSELYPAARHRDRSGLNFSALTAHLAPLSRLRQTTLLLSLLITPRLICV